MNTSSQLQPEEPQLQPKSNNKLSWILIIAIITIIIAAGDVWYLKFYNQLSKTTETNTATTTPTTENTSTANSTAIKNDSDLQSASVDLDSSNVDSIDTGLSQNDVDSSAF